jgi:hypothetical protein
MSNCWGTLVPMPSGQQCLQTKFETNVSINTLVLACQVLVLTKAE